MTEIERLAVAMGKEIEARHGNDVCFVKESRWDRESDLLISGHFLSYDGTIDLEAAVRAILQELTRHHGPECECEPCRILSEECA